MAREKSQAKRHAILASAVREIALVGPGASTSRIAKGAGLAEGTLFTYFATKDELLNELYVELKSDVFRRINAAFPHRAPLRTRALHVWTAYLLWATEKANERKASVQLHVSDVITGATKSRVDAEHGAVAQMIKEVSMCGAFKHLPPDFASSAMVAMQEAVMDVAAKKPRQRNLLIEHTFAAFWRMAE